METITPLSPPGVDLELVSLRHCGLVDVAAQDQFRTGVDERGQDMRSPRDRLLSRPPGRADHLVMHGDHAQRARRSLGEELRGALELLLADSARLVSPGAHRVEPDHVQGLRAEDGLGGLPVALELVKRARESGRERVRDVVIAGDRQHGETQRAQERRGGGMLLRPATMCEIAARDHELGLEPFDELLERALDRRSLLRPHMEVRNVEHTRGHGGEEANGGRRTTS